MPTFLIRPTKAQIRQHDTFSYRVSGTKNPLKRTVKDDPNSSTRITFYKVNQVFIRFPKTAKDAWIKLNPKKTIVNVCYEDGKNVKTASAKIMRFVLSSSQKSGTCEFSVDLNAEVQWCSDKSTSLVSIKTINGLE